MWLEKLQSLGFWGIELNLPDLSAISPAELKELLEEHQLHLTYLAPGAYAKARGLSLSSPDPEVRKRSVEGCLANLAYAAQMGAGIILGFFKGGPLEDEEAARLAFIESLHSVCEQFSETLPILVEATNRRETCVVRTLADAEQVIAAVNEAMRAADTDAANNMSRLTGGLNLGGMF